MTRALSLVLLRTLAAYCMLKPLGGLAEFLIWITGSSSAASTGETQLAYYAAFFMFGAQFIAGVLIWLMAAKLVAWLLPDLDRTDANPPGEQTVLASDIVAAGTFVIGLFWVFSLLPQLAGTALYYLGTDRLGVSHPLSYSIKHAVTWLQFGLAVAIMLGMRWVVALFTLLRGDRSFS